jgi:uncharacterized delta-60 repeat protein
MTVPLPWYLGAPARGAFICSGDNIVSLGEPGWGYGSLLIDFFEDGGVNPSFADAGYALLNVAPNTDCAISGVLAADTEVIGFGTFSNTTSGATSDFLLARLRADGTLNPAFGFGGFVQTTLPGGQSSAYAAVRQTDGRLVVVGTTFDAGRSYAVVVRYNDDGTLDSTFAQFGKALFPVGAQATAVGLQSDGRIVVAGGISITGPGWFVMRLWP